MSRTSPPVRIIGRQPFRRIPIARLGDVETGCKLALERELREAPTPISGGMRKALSKELGRQNGLRFHTARRFGEADLRRAYGLLEVTCRFCRHSMFFDEADGGFGDLRCDRCKRVI